MLTELETATQRKLPANFASLLAATTLQKLRRELRATAHVAYALTWLRGPKCVASSSPLDRVRVSLEATGLLGYFDPHLFSASEVPRGKPAPDLFEYVARKMTVKPADCIVVEDSPAGVSLPIDAWRGRDHQRQRLLRGPEVAFATDPNQRLTPDPDSRAVGRALAFHERQIECTFAETIQQMQGEVATDLERHRRIGLGETREHRRKVAGGEILRRAQSHGAAHSRFVHPRHHLVVEVEQLPRIVQKRFALRRELHGMRIAVEQLAAELVLQPLDLKRDRRLLAPHGLRGARERAGMCDCGEGADEVEVEVLQWARHAQAFKIEIFNLNILYY